MARLKLEGVHENLVDKHTNKSKGHGYYKITLPNYRKDTYTYSFSISPARVNDYKLRRGTYYDVDLGPSGYEIPVECYNRETGQRTREYWSCGKVKKLYEKEKQRARERYEHYQDVMNAKSVEEYSTFKNRFEPIVDKVVESYDVDEPVAIKNFDGQTDAIIYDDTNYKNESYLDGFERDSIREPLTHTKSNNRYGKRNVARQDGSIIRSVDKESMDNVAKEELNLYTSRKEASEVDEVSKSAMRKSTEVSETYSIDAFNNIRGLKEKSVHKTSDGREYNGYINDYIFSESELSLLDSGDYIIAADVPSRVKGVDKHGNAKTYEQMVHYKISLDTDANTGKTFLHMDTIDLDSEDFRDKKHNQRYAMNTSSYDYRFHSDFSASLVSDARRKAHIDAMLDAYKPVKTRAKHEIKNPYLPTLKHKAFTIKGSHSNSYERLNDAYQKLRMLPASEEGKALGFETMYDERRFNDKRKLVNNELKTTELLLNEYCSKTVAENIRDGLSEQAQASVETNLQYEIDVWCNRNQALDNELKLRQTPCFKEESIALGCKNAYEENVVDNYNSLMETWKSNKKEYDYLVKSESGKLIIFNYQRWQETKLIREVGFESHLSRVKEEREARLQTLGVQFFDATKAKDVPDFSS